MMSCWRSAALLGVAVSLASPAAAQWRVARHTDEMTDETVTMVSLPATTTTPNGADSARTLIGLFCHDGRLDRAFVAWPDPVVDESVILRFDRDSAYRDAWELGPDAESSASREPTALVDSLLLHRTFRARALRRDGRAVTATFSLGVSFGPRATAVAQACGIDPVARARALRTAVGSIELAVRDRLRREADPGPLALRPLVTAVRDREGRSLTRYTLGARVTVAEEGRTTMVTGDTVELEPGTETEVLITANEHPAPYAIRFLVRAAIDDHP